MKKNIYIILVSFFVLLGIIFSVILTYNYFMQSLTGNTPIELFCSKGGYFDCHKVSSSKFSSLFGVPVALWGIGFYIITILYFLLPTLNDDNPKTVNNFLTIPYFLILIIANLADLVLFYISIFVIGAFCSQCSLIYIANVGILIVFYLYEFREKGIIHQFKDYLSSFPKDNAYQKELATYFTMSLLILSLLFFFSNNRSLNASVKKLLTKSDPLKEYVEKAFQEYKTKSPQSINTLNTPSKGDKNAPMHIIVFHDLQCPHCQNSFYELEQIIKKYKPLVRLNYLDFPFLPSRTGVSQLTSFQLTVYAYFAHKSGKYMEFLDSLFQIYKKKIYVNKNEVYKIFKLIGINDTPENIEKQTAELIKEVLVNKKYYDEVFDKNHFKGTPAILINGKPVSGHIKKIITRILEHEIIEYAKTCKESKTPVQNK